MNAKVIQGTYADFKIVKTRNVAQFIVEVPLEQANAAVNVFGLPDPTSEKWVAIAMLNEHVIERNESATKAIQVAGMLCREAQFGKFLRDHLGMREVEPMNSQSIADGLRALLGIKSRTEMHDQPETVVAFNRIKGEYDKWLMNETT